MKIEELQPKLLKYTLIPINATILERDGYSFDVLKTNVRIAEVSTVAECNGISFLCPRCLNTQYQHDVVCWSNQGGVHFSAFPATYRWKISGNDFSDVCITLDFKNQFAFDNEHCAWHGAVIFGEIK